MPKSPGRRTRKDPRRAPRRTTSQLDPDDLRHNVAVLRAVDAAEARGDAAAALDLMTAPVKGPSDRVFWRPWRTRHLSQMVTLGPILPRWATSRWIVGQALQCLDASSRNRGLRALEVAIETRGGPGTLRGVDEADARCKVIDHDWVYRQVHLYELGGLDHYVRRVASPDLVVGADRMHDWARMPMGGFRLVSETGRTASWARLDTGEEIEALNLGSGLLLDVGECAIGRLVPISDGVMFESAPLPVPEIVAEQVASYPGGWIDAVKRGCRQFRGTDAELMTSGLHDFALLTDVPEVLWRALARGVVGLPQSGAGSQGSTDLRHDAARLVRVALDLIDEGSFLVDQLPCVAAALVEPGVSDHLLGSLGPGDVSALTRLSEAVTAPASDICLWMARDLRQSA